MASLVDIAVPSDIIIVVFESLAPGPSLRKKLPFFEEPGVSFRRISWPFDHLDGSFDFLTICLPNHFDGWPVK
jgi:hypothetical protein